MSLKHENKHRIFNRESWLFMLVTVFLFVTITYVINELRTPLFVAKTTLKIEPHAKINGNFSNNFYRFQALVRTNASKIGSTPILEILAQNPRVIELSHEPSNSLMHHLGLDAFINRAMTPLKKDVTLMNRLRDSLSIEINPDNLNLEITVHDSNPQLAQLIAQELPQIFINQELTSSPLVTEALQNINDEVSAAVTEFQHSPVAQTEVSKQEALKEEIATLTSEETSLKDKINNLSLLIDHPQGELPVSYINTPLGAIYEELTIKQLQSQARKMQPGHDKTLLTAMRRLGGDFNSQLKDEIANLQSKLSRVQSKQRDLSLAAGIVPTAQTSQDNSFQLDEKIFDALLSENKIKTLVKNENITILEKAKLPLIPVYPNKSYAIMMAFLAGIFTSLSFIFIKAWFSTKVESDTDIFKYLDLPVLGVIPKTE